MTKTILNNSLKWGGVAALLASTLAISNAAEAISLIGNYSSTNDGDFTVIYNNNHVAYSFTSPSGANYQLDNIELRLSNYNTTQGDIPLLQIYADSSKTSTNPSGATLQPLLFNNPVSSSFAISNFTFTPTSSFTFVANTRYWLLVKDATGGISGFFWWANYPSYITPTGVATFDSYQFSNNNGESYVASDVRNSFNINVTESATPVPFEFEGTGGLMVVGSVWLLRRHLKKKETKV